MIISGLCFAGAGAMLYRLIRLDYSHEIAVRTLKFLCILPGAFFFASPMSESLFLLLSVSCFYYLREKTGSWPVYWQAGHPIPVLWAWSWQYPFYSK